LRFPMCRTAETREKMPSMNSSLILSTIMAPRRSSYDCAKRGQRNGRTSISFKKVVRRPSTETKLPWRRRRCPRCSRNSG
jgi:hypothetical protein